MNLNIEQPSSPGSYTAKYLFCKFEDYSIKDLRQNIYGMIMTTQQQHDKNIWKFEINKINTFSLALAN